MFRNHNWCLFCWHRPRYWMWVLVGISNWGNKSCSKALKPRLVAARLIDQFHAYKAALLSNLCRCTTACDRFDAGTDDLERQSSTEHVFPRCRCSLLSLFWFIFTGFQSLGKKKKDEILKRTFIFSVPVRLIWRMASVRTSHIAGHAMSAEAN